MGRREVIGERSKFVAGAALRAGRFLTEIVLFALALSTHNARALQYQRIPLKLPKVAIMGRGPIIPGDVQRLARFFSSMPSTDQLAAFILDSPGGDVTEAERFAALVRKLRLAVVIPPDSECSSACFLIFAAAPLRIAAPDALIGVHSASTDGHETRGSLAVTTLMARDLAGDGVPDAIIGKLVTTPPGRATWLTPTDFASMRVQLVGEERSSSGGQADASPAAPGNQAHASPMAAPRPTGDPAADANALNEGLYDRQTWENWFGGLAGEFRAGAEWWTAHQSDPTPSSCRSVDEGKPKEWIAGCLAARNLLRPFDLRRRLDPEYREGWNSY